ncbi:hypothetical protein KKF91_06755 [Myxococcota bacterium]|nr:hypothetical protein [Myxococcota bacterium]MBU1430255.1 hypothetical protein [Myxococcota bacterium]MBU1898804.1 hypothetical protein [Myxococcota bacterium]
MNRDDALKLLAEVFQEGLPDLLAPEADTPLLGPDAALESIDLVNFVADVEDAIQARLGVALVLADERALSRSKSPFRDLSALADYLVERLSDA